MAYANNRAAARPRTSFQPAGGTIMKFRHPMLAGQISRASPIDEVDVSRALKLNDNFLSATPANDHSYQEVLVDGSVITITNHQMNGVLALSVLPTTGIVGTGDFIAVAHLIISSKDSEGGVFTVNQKIDGKRRITVFYGTSFKNVPHMLLAGNAVPVYQMQMLYSGWVQGISGADSFNEKVIWAVGNKYGLKAAYRPYGLMEAENPNDFYGGGAYTVDGVDSNTADIDNPAGLQDAAGGLNDALKGASVYAPVPPSGTPTSPIRTNPDSFPGQQ